MEPRDKSNQAGGSQTAPSMGSNSGSPFSPENQNPVSGSTPPDSASVPGPLNSTNVPGDTSSTQTTPQSPPTIPSPTTGNAVAPPGDTTSLQSPPTSIVPPTTPNPSSPIDPGMALTATPKSSGRKFKILMIIFIILLLGVLVAVGYLYVTNRKLKNELSQMKQDQVLTTPVTEPSRAPLPSEEISVENGSVIRTNSSGEKALLIDKTLYENVGIIGFARVIVSPDEKKMCFEAWPPAPTPGLYLADITGQNVVYVADNGKDCVWSNDSTKIAYTKQAVKTSQVDLFYYDLTSTEEINLTKDAAGPGMLRVYENPTWSVDNQTITATYTETDPTKAVADTTGVSEITVLTGKVSDQNNITLSATPSPSPKPSAPPVQI